jgi:hypothetical protein
MFDSSRQQTFLDRNLRQILRTISREVNRLFVVAIAFATLQLSSPSWASDSPPVIETCVRLDLALDASLETRNGTKLYWRSSDARKSGDVLVVPRRGCSIKIRGVLPDQRPETMGERIYWILSKKDIQKNSTSIARVQLEVLSRAKKKCRTIPEKLSTEDQKNNQLYKPTLYETCIGTKSQALGKQLDFFLFHSSFAFPEFQVFVTVFRGCLYGYEIIPLMNGYPEPATHESPEGAGKCT